MRPMDLKEFFLKQKEAIRGRTRQVTQLIRTEHMNWRPEKDALSVGEMLRHLWHSEEGVRRVALKGDFSYYEKRIPLGLRAVFGTPGSLEEELNQLERAHSETLAAVANFPPELWDEVRVHEELGFRRKVAVILPGSHEHEKQYTPPLMNYPATLRPPA